MQILLLNLSILNSYLSDFESILQSQDLININFKKFISLKINENIEKTFKFLNQKYNIDNNPIIKYRTIQGSKESIKQQLISYL